ncbi:MAG TPA: hypothetical protein VIJ78_01375 [Pseudolabrys sp.]
MRTRELFEMLGFQQDWEANTDQRPAYYYDFGNLRLTAAEVMSDGLRPCFHLGGVQRGANSIGMVDFEMPVEIESYEQGVAWIWYGVGEKFEPRIPTSWLAEGQAWKKHLPWIRRMRDYERRPQCLVEKNWFRVAIKKLRPLAATASESDLVWLSFDGESLRIAACGATIVLPATGVAWGTHYAIKATALNHLPRRLTTHVPISVWNTKLSIGSKVWHLAEPDPIATRPA